MQRSDYAKKKEGPKNNERFGGSDAALSMAVTHVREEDDGEAASEAAGHRPSSPSPTGHRAGRHVGGDHIPWVPHSQAFLSRCRPRDHGLDVSPLPIDHRHVRRVGNLNYFPVNTFES
jgi:hypothetical protein